jgi:hypothetical protein
MKLERQGATDDGLEAHAMPSCYSPPAIGSLTDRKHCIPPTAAAAVGNYKGIFRHGGALGLSRRVPGVAAALCGL